MPLSRSAVREILDEYANNGRGVGAGRVDLTWEELHAAHETAHRSRSAVRKRDQTNAESLANNRAKIDFTFTHALVALKLDKSFSAIDQARNRLIKGPDAENAKSSSTAGLRNQFSAFFGQALRLMDPGVHESAEFTLCGQTTKLVKGEDGSVAAIVGKGELATKVPLTRDAESLVVELIGRSFKINTNAVRNAQGGFTTEPYKDKTPEQIKAELDAKDLNRILDDAASDNSSPGQVALFKQVLSDYFSGMTRPSDRRMAFAASLRYASAFDFAGKQGDALQSAIEAATKKFAGAILKGTSPLLQKMMQGLPRSVLGGFAEALDDMKSNLAPIPRKVVQAHLMKMIDDSNGKIESIKLVESLGAASVGEAFLCEFRYKEGGKTKKEQMVVKIMRHDAEARMKREAEVISAAAEKIGPGMLKTWQGQLEQYKTEFDFRTEAVNVGTGVTLYDVRGNADHPMRAIASNVGSMKLSDLVAPSKNAMVCTLVSGSTVDKFFAHSRSVIQENLAPVFERDAETDRLKWDPVTKKPILKSNLGAGKLDAAKLFINLEYGRILEAQKRLREAAGLWFTEAILGSGQFHGDAHAGNLIISSLGERIDFIDYGNMYKLETHYELDERGNPVMETVPGVDEDGRPTQVQRPKVRLNERVELLRLFLGATLRNKAFFLQGFEKLLSESGRKTLEANREKAEAIVDAMLAKGAFSFDVCYRLQGRALRAAEARPRDAPADLLLRAVDDALPEHDRRDERHPQPGQGHHRRALRRAAAGGAAP